MSTEQPAPTPAAPAAPAAPAVGSNPPAATPAVGSNPPATTTPKPEGFFDRLEEGAETALHDVERIAGEVLPVAKDAAKAIEQPAPAPPAGSFQATIDGLVDGEIKTLLAAVPCVAAIDAVMAEAGLSFTLETLLVTAANNAVAAGFDHLGAITDRKPLPPPAPPAPPAPPSGA